MEISEVKQNYDLVYKAADAMQKAGVALARSKENLELMVLEATNSGLIIGKNETERQACAHELFKNAYESNSKFAIDYQEKLNALKLAEILLNCTRDIIRVEELAKVTS